MPGMAIHELGQARMGADPTKSVLTAFNQAHDVKNLFVMDGASFVSSACQNPTLTMDAHHRSRLRESDRLLPQERSLAALASPSVLSTNRVPRPDPSASSLSRDVRNSRLDILFTRDAASGLFSGN